MYVSLQKLDLFTYKKLKSKHGHKSMGIRNLMKHLWPLTVSSGLNGAFRKFIKMFNVIIVSSCDHFFNALKCFTPRLGKQETPVLILREYRSNDRIMISHLDRNKCVTAKTQIRRCILNVCKTDKYSIHICIFPYYVWSKTL